MKQDMFRMITPTTLICVQHRDEIGFSVSLLSGGLREEQDISGCLLLPVVCFPKKFLTEISGNSNMCQFKTIE